MKTLMTAVIVLALAATQSSRRNPATVILKTPRRAVQIDHFFFETARGRTPLPTELTHSVLTVSNRRWTGEAMTADGHKVRLTITPQGTNFDFSMSATPAADITKWGFRYRRQARRVFHRPDGARRRWAAASVLGYGNLRSNEPARAKSRDDREADHIDLCSFLPLVARLRCFCEGHVARSLRFCGVTT